MTERGETIEPFPLGRRGTVDYMRTAGRRSVVHGLVELDVTEARRRIRELEERTGTRRSFTAFLVFCLARAIDDHPHVQTYRDWRGRLVRFEDVDVNVLIEREVDGDRIGVPHVIRAVNRRSLESIHDEIRAAQTDPSVGRQRGLAAAGLRLPGPVRRLLWRLPQVSPRHWKRLAGTVAVTSVGMFGDGGGWAVAPTNYALQLTVGGIERKPGLVDNEVVPREYLSLTVTVDHDVVDGAPAARFVGRLRELVEAAHGLDEDLET
ncbi:catalytic domain of components of various dehydrogenase complexes [Natronococcus amylolyticus DSM 10524]|uniref:Catalytic domain of components of various dehydrogenase complexes n=1 Tax=Natronococcus amylolyticus DSM 10524 TaxID=1227497 RepID=L9X0P8_9EURY|nr:2-oxo acid dehydrogenase subunit E2 [Natronococcus amylolyticus]ELY54178.1 catalytic domain of components of various dehydrogenase complexes [Natronococcus amylolyticus DSM 10524]